MLQDHTVYLKMKFSGCSEEHIAYVLLSDNDDANDEYYEWLEAERDEGKFAHPDDADWDLERVYHPPVPSIYLKD